MPQYELELAEEENRILRARSVEDAVFRAGRPDAVVDSSPDVQGWRSISEKEIRIGRVREHNRMRFRRD